MRQQLLVLGCVVVMVVGGLAAPVPSQAEVRPQAGTARVRFVNASADAPALNAFVGDTLWASSVVEAAGYFDIPAGEHVFIFRLPDRPDDLAQVRFTLEPDDRVTVAAVNTLGDLEAVAFNDDVSAPARNAARVKVVHAAPEAGTVRVLLGDQVVGEALAYGDVSVPLQVIAGAFTLDVLAEDGRPLLTPSEQVFEANSAYTVFVVGGEVAWLLTVRSSVLRPAGDSQIRFAHMAQGLGAVTAYINHELAPIYSSIRLGGVTNYLVTGQGRHLVEVYPADVRPGTQEPLASAAAEIGPNQHVVFVAHGTAGNLALTPYVTDIGPVPPNSSRLNVIHAADGNPALRVATWEGAPLVERVEPGAAAERVVPAGAYSLVVTDADGAAEDEALMQKPGVFVPAGSATLLIVYDNDPDAPLVNAAVVPTDNVPQYAYVRWLNAAPGVDAVDVYLDGVLFAEALAYGEPLPYGLLAPGAYAVEVYRAGANPAIRNPIYARTLDMSRTDAPRTVVIYGPVTALRVEMMPDNVALLPPGMARIRFINAAASVESFRAVDAVVDVTWVATVQYGAGSIHVNAQAGVYDVELRQWDTLLTTLDDLALQAGNVYTVVLVGAGDDSADYETFVLIHAP